MTNIKSIPGHVDLFSSVRKNRRIFVETGTYNGNGIMSALESGYEKIISFEIDEKKVRTVRKKLTDAERVWIHHASSCSMEFVNAVKSIKEPAVFWLDAHPDGIGPNPLITELLFIGASPFSHGILIDDVRLFGKYRVTEELLCSVLTACGRPIKTEYKTIRGKFENDVLYIELDQKN